MKGAARRLFAQIFRLRPGAIVPHQLDPAQELETIEFMAAGGEQASESCAAQAEIDKRGSQAALVIDAGAAAGREIAMPRHVNAFLVFDGGNRFGNQEVEVHVALAVGMRDHIGAGMP